jgi:glyoxylase-like metal-dependent hydrolase (beta-lactamase superfamily II)
MARFPVELSKRIVPLRGFMGLCHLLIEENNKGAVLIDTGLFGEAWMLKLALNKRGLSPKDIKAVLMTHGHLDHSGNLSYLKKLTGAKIYAHPLEQDIINGCFDYQGINTWCGRLESLGRKVLRVGKPVAIDEHLEDGQLLPFFGGLRVVHLPGHTLGHCGFFSDKQKLLFSGDLFSSYTMFSHLPPPILNTAPELMLHSLEKAWNLEPEFVIPQHYDFFTPTKHKDRLEDIYFTEKVIAKVKKETAENKR